MYLLMQNFSTIFISIIVEALPFILIGVLVSSIIQVFISEEHIKKLIPKRKFLGVAAASLMGFVFPVCECGIIPVARRLIKKGVPAYMGITFLLAAPIVNPVVIASTYYAFAGRVEMVYARVLGALFIAITVGIIFLFMNKDVDPLKADIDTTISCGCASHEHEQNCSCKNYEHFKQEIEDEELLELLKSEYDTLCNDNKLEACCSAHADKKVKPAAIMKSIIEHSIEEFFEMGRFLIFGAALAASVQVIIPRSTVLAFAEGRFLSIFIMMALAYVLSLCSEADAFVARSFGFSFSNSSILSFLVFGPMLDIKNTAMLFGSFKVRFAALFITVVTLLNLIVFYISSYLF
ncbi:MAG: permease [Bacillota bacterium]